MALENVACLLLGLFSFQQKEMSVNWTDTDTQDRVEDNTPSSDGQLSLIIKSLRKTILCPCPLSSTKPHIVKSMYSS